MKSLFSKWKKKNNGSSFVVVVVSLTFIGIIALALLSITLMNYKRMAITRKNDSTYYAVETAADQLKTGITDKANQALQAAYADLEPRLKYWDTTAGAYMLMSDADANRELRRLFVDKLYVMLCGSTPTEATTYTNLCTMIKTDEAKLLDPTTAAGYLGSSYNFEVIKTVDETNDVYKIEIKGLLFEAVADTNDGYMQNLYTDLEILAPSMELKFNTASTDESSFLEYILVADDGFEIQNHGMNQPEVVLRGNIYAGVDWDENEITLNTAYNSKYDYNAETSINSGIYASNVALRIFANDLVTAGNIVSDNSSAVEIRSRTGTELTNEIWCRNLITMASDEEKQSAVLNVKGVMNVYDDLEINADRSSVKLEGEYCGYNYGSFGSSSDEVKASYEGHYKEVYGDLSSTYGKHYNTSSILINGNFANLDMLGLTKLTVQGKTHIDMETDSYVMGESISVKGNQLAYSVPNELLSEKAIGGYVGIDPDKLDALGEAGDVLERLLTSDSGTINYAVFPLTPFSTEALNGRYYYYFVGDARPMTVPWDIPAGAVSLTAEQKAEEYFKWYMSEDNGYTNNDELLTYDVATGSYNGNTVFALNTIRVSDNGEYGKVYSNGSIMVKEGTSAESSALSIGVGSASASLATQQAAKIRDYNFQLHYLRSAQEGDGETPGAVNSSPVNVFLNVIKDTSLPISSRQLTEHATYLNNFCGYRVGNQVDQVDPADSSRILYSIIFAADRDVVVDADFTGFIFTTEDVYIEPGCGKISGMICAGGKVYVQDRSTKLEMEANSNVMENLIKTGFTENADSAKWLQDLFMVDPDTLGGSSEAVGAVNEDKNLRNYNCKDDVITMNYQKNIEYTGR
ncbi:MAG: hypothetical protein IJA32_14895 [Lachnospiraceae bacterium]|nr:hypothetical protein [Lachnospiraceae bacterium]